MLVVNSTVQDKLYLCNIGFSMVALEHLRNTELESELNLNEIIKYKCYLNLNRLYALISVNYDLTQLY